MNLLKKIFTAIQSGESEAGTTLVDADGIRLLEDEIQEAENRLELARQELSLTATKAAGVNSEINRLQQKIDEYEGYVIQAFKKNDEILATDHAEIIALLEEELSVQKKLRNSLAAHEGLLAESIKQIERQLAEYKRQLVMVKTADSVHKATSAITECYNKNRMLSATESLERIRQKQKEFDDKLKAAQVFEAESADSSLEEQDRIASTGPQTSTASSVLERIKAKKGA